MHLEITQKQNRLLLEEHAQSSFNWGIGKFELVFPSVFIIIGIVISIVNNNSILTGLPFIGIGIFEIIKYPTREKRWVNKKVKEPIFDQNITFLFQDKELKISFSESSKSYQYKNISKCLVSNTGILLKITFSEYYFISFKSIGSEENITRLITHLYSSLKTGSVKVKRHTTQK
jgi:hypothetical protein|tara:strand:+ start:88 stop:609 length:522 start_codon:yes stop_codon:yes gene_type:complete